MQQVAIAESVDSFLTVLHQFREALLEIPLPPPSAVDLGQAIKDAQRETIVLNGKAFQGDAIGLEAEMLRLVEPLVVDVETAKMLCQDILRASSRTASGGDSYSIGSTILVRRGNLLTPAQVESAPITISIGVDGVVEIKAENVFTLHRNMMPDINDDPNAGSPSQENAGTGGHHKHHHHHHHHKKVKSILSKVLNGGKDAPSPSRHGGGSSSNASSPTKGGAAESSQEGGGEVNVHTLLEVSL